MKRQSVAIIGAGTAGLATAIVLAKQGHDVTIFEQAVVMENVGAGLLLQPSGMAVFQHLGALEHALDLGAPVDALQGWSKTRLLVNSRYAEAAAEWTGLGMHRAALCAVLMQQLKALDIPIHMATEVTAVVDHQDQMQVDTLTQDVNASLKFDMVLVANGARSQLRPEVWTRLDQPYPWGAVWAIVPETTTLDYRILHQFYHGASRMMGLLPTGSVPNSGQRLTSIFWSLPSAQIDPWINASQDEFQKWQDEVSQIWPAAGAWIKDSIQSSRQFMAARYRDVVMSRYGQNRLGVIGDAAHAMSPQLGQGANMALLDAWAIGQAFAKSTNYAEVWSQYHQLRQPSIQFYQSMSRLLTPFYQSHSISYGVMRDVAFTWMYRLPWLRKQMAATISGVKIGPLREIDLESIRRSHPV
ncbi:FAD-dependent oxidoreductase [Aquirhabdus sp.]|uniref:FAD-dependent oxidoreductase n=1 Tax=Aquirhabdus sp. TaxID=2824160 RepID=UPI00396CAA56